MPTLYLQPFCQYCEKVMRFVSEHKVSINAKDISNDPSLAAELIRLGGKRQVPYLVDEAQGTAMYESADIIEYLRSNYVH